MMFASQPLSHRRPDLKPVPAPGDSRNVLPENPHLTEAGHSWFRDCNRSEWAVNELARLADVDTPEADHARRVLGRIYFLATNRPYEPSQAAGPFHLKAAA